MPTALIVIVCIAFVALIGIGLVTIIQLVTKETRRARADRIEIGSMRSREIVRDICKTEDTRGVVQSTSGRIHISNIELMEALNNYEEGHFPIDMENVRIRTVTGPAGLNGGYPESFVIEWDRRTGIIPADPGRISR